MYMRDSHKPYINAAESFDYGKTWDFVCYVGEPDEHIFYPHSFVDSEKRLVYLAYENARQHYLNIYTFEELGI